MVFNNYVPEYVPENLPWYEKDGLLTWYDQAKCKEFLEDPDPILKTKNSDFDIIYKSVRREKIPEIDLKNYQTVTMDSLKKYSKKEETNFLSAAFRSDGKDL